MYPHLPVSFYLYLTHTGILRQPRSPQNCNVSNLDRDFCYPHSSVPQPLARPKSPEPMTSMPEGIGAHSAAKSGGGHCPWQWSVVLLPDLSIAGAPRTASGRSVAPVGQQGDDAKTFRRRQYACSPCCLAWAILLQNQLLMLHSQFTSYPLHISSSACISPCALR